MRPCSVSQTMSPLPCQQGSKGMVSSLPPHTAPKASIPPSKAPSPSGASPGPLRSQPARSQQGPPS